MATFTKAQSKRERALRRRNLARAIDLTWSSLRSHLADAVTRRRIHGNEEWNARCVREYAEVQYTLAVELHELTKRDFRRDFMNLSDAI